MSKIIDHKARAVQEIANQLGWKEDVKKLIERVNQLDKGLVQEDEFIYIINWSNKCKLIHKLDQLQLPLSSKDYYTIPDILVEFETKEGPKKYLIEIKTSKRGALSWTEKYYNGLINYSKLIGIPILIAWKWNPFGIWTLFEMEHFSKPVINYKIGFEKAHQENLMSNFFNDYVIILYEQTGLVIEMKKIKIESEVINKKGDKEVIWQTEISDIYITDENNEKVKEINKSVILLLFSMNMEPSVTQTDTHIITKYTPEPNKMQFAQSIPIQLYKAFADDDVNWLIKSKENSYPIESSVLIEGLSKAIDDKIVRNILITKPLSEK